MLLRPIILGGSWPDLDSKSPPRPDSELSTLSNAPLAKYDKIVYFAYLALVVIAEFGTDHVYNCDTFNEMVPSSGELDYLSAVGHATFQAMIDIDPTAIWVKQSWEFLHSPFWTIKRVKSFLTSVPIGRMLVLDLQSEQYEQYTTYSSYFGQPFIWCMLHNFGGTLGLFGSMSIINQKVFVARALLNGTMVGTGLTPEGINQNYVIYDLMTEMSWRTEPTNLTQWVSAYATRRYGEENDDSNQAWDLLKAWFNVSDVASAWYHLLAASPHLESVPTFQHDLVDVTRQVLQNLGTSLYVIIVDAYRSKNISSFQNNAALMLDLLTDLDNVLSSNRAFLLGTWLEAAKALATTPLVRHQFVIVDLFLELKTAIRWINGLDPMSEGLILPSENVVILYSLAGIKVPSSSSAVHTTGIQRELLP
uniref:Alpha-N-acetylglucosaminidase n=1 Tax=Timema douglasi TaxID=61478 RepID=A0A7R8Z7E4_TIMDO|nr:unnamed protein product [Timema douglasi]